MRRHTHHCAFAITDKHVISDPHWELFAGQRMHDEDACGHALLLDLCELRFRDRTLVALLDEGLDLRITVCRRLSDWMLGGDSHEGGAHQRVRARCEHPEDLLLSIQL